MYLWIILALAISGCSLGPETSQEWQDGSQIVWKHGYGKAKFNVFSQTVEKFDAEGKPMAFDIVGRFSFDKEGYVTDSEFYAGYEPGKSKIFVMNLDGTVDKVHSEGGK